MCIRDRNEWCVIVCMVLFGDTNGSSGWCDIRYGRKMRTSLRTVGVRARPTVPTNGLHHILPLTIQSITSVNSSSRLQISILQIWWKQNSVMPSVDIFPILLTTIALLLNSFHRWMFVQLFSTIHAGETFLGSPKFWPFFAWGDRPKPYFSKQPSTTGKIF